MDKFMAGKSFGNASGRRISAGEDFTGRLVYFSGLQDDPNYHELEGKLILVAEDTGPASKTEDTNYIFGYVLNQPMNTNLRRHLDLLPGERIATQLQFRQIMDSDSTASAWESEHFETTFLTFITRKDAAGNFKTRQTFGEFAAYVCETTQEAVTVAKLLEDVPEIILVSSQIMMEREDFMKFLWNNQAKQREATPEIVLNQSAFMREMLAFPDEPHFKR
jgi:hypothetical protein